MYARNVNMNSLTLQNFALFAALRAIKCHWSLKKGIWSRNKKTRGITRVEEAKSVRKSAILLTFWV